MKEKTDKLTADDVREILNKHTTKPDGEGYFVTEKAIIAIMNLFNETEDNSFWSPIPAERQGQLNRLKKLFPGYPNDSFHWQYLNGLLQYAESYAAQEKQPPFPDKMSFKEMLQGLFNTDFLSENELQTICDAGELYAQGCLRQEKQGMGEWQLCPKCLGSGRIDNPYSTSVYTMCDVCNGAKVLAKPPLPSQSNPEEVGEGQLWEEVYHITEGFYLKIKEQKIKALTTKFTIKRK